VAAPAPDLSAGSIWQAMLAVLRQDFWTLFALAAPFTLLVDMVLAQFGPPRPKTIAEFTPQVLLILVFIPALIGIIAQLAVALLAAAPARPPRAALAAALRRAPFFLVAVMMIAWPLGLAGGLVAALPGLRWATGLLVVPGLYLAARLFPMVVTAVVEPIGPVAILQRTWQMTAGRVGAIAWLMLLSLLLLIAASLITTGVGGALGSVLTLIGLKPVGVFVANLANALLACLFSIGSAVAAAQIYQRLR
jgi:hypothetical protein